MLLNLSRKPVLDHLGRLHARKPLVEALELVGQSGVLDAKRVEDGGVQVADVNRDDLPPISPPPARPRFFNASTRKQIPASHR